MASAPSLRTPPAPRLMWAAAAAAVVVVVAAACVGTAAGAEGVPGPGVGRAGPELLQDAAQHLLDWLAPAPRPASLDGRRAGRRPPPRLAVQRRPPPRLAVQRRPHHQHQHQHQQHHHHRGGGGGGGDALCLAGVCVHPGVGAVLVGALVAVKAGVLVLASVSGGSSKSVSSLSRAAPNITNIISVQTTNTVTLNTDSGGQSQMQTQDMMEDQDQDQDQDIFQDLYNEPDADASIEQDQTESLNQDQTFNFMGG